jgi:hypothetical protein
MATDDATLLEFFEWCHAHPNQIMIPTWESKGKDWRMPLAPPLKEGLYLHCLEDGAMTPVEEGENQSTTPCAQCEDQGREDPYCTELVRVENCAVGDSCEADNHHHGHGQHFVEIEQ